MKLAVLYSGGKDSTLALDTAMSKETVECLISISSKNKASYMFHTPNINLTGIQADSIGLPLILKETDGEKEEELNDLKQALKDARKTYGIEGVVTGAIESVYQAIRVQRICDELGLWCFNPLWQIDQVELLRVLVQRGYTVIITGVFAYPCTEEWLGREIDDKAIQDLIRLRDDVKINPSGEGGEFETTVLSGPIFKRRIMIRRSEKTYNNYRGVYNILEAGLE